MNPTVVSTSHAPLLSAPPAYSLAEELAHAVTHGVGIVLAIAGLCVLVAYAALYGSALHVVSCSIFGSSMILLYTGSTLYHSVQHVQAKYRLRKLDQSMVYLLIAGTYTPFNLITLNGPLGWWLFAITWSIALFGIAFCVVDHERHERFALAFYLGLGWSIVFAVPSLIHRHAVRRTGIAVRWRAVLHHRRRVSICANASAIFMRSGICSCSPAVHAALLHGAALCDSVTAPNRHSRLRGNDGFYRTRSTKKPRRSGASRPRDS
jgi:hemolysin III